jgi:hypothetical protein
MKSLYKLVRIYRLHTKILKSANACYICGKLLK